MSLDNMLLEWKQNFFINRKQMFWTTFSGSLNFWFEALSSFLRVWQFQFLPSALNFE